MQRINKLIIQSRASLASGVGPASASFSPSLTIRRASHLPHSVQLHQCANRSLCTNNILRTLSSSNRYANNTSTSILAPVRPFSTSSSSSSPEPVSATVSDPRSQRSSHWQPLRIVFLAVVAMIAGEQVREALDPEYAADKKKHPGRFQMIKNAVIEANERFDIENTARLAMKQQAQPDKHIKGERKSGALVQSPDATTAAPITPAPVTPATPVVAQNKPSSSAATESNDPYDPECRVCRSGGEQTDINAFYRNQSQIAAAASNAASDFALNPNGSVIIPAASCPPCYAYSHSLCPLNRAEVGRAAWGYLHTIAAYYPATPSQRQQTEMAQFLHLFMKLYPCGYCADRSMEQLEREPIENYVSSQAALSGWMCRLHNEVNERLGKPIFQCEFSNARWRDGPPTGECD